MEINFVADPDLDERLPNEEVPPRSDPVHGDFSGTALKKSCREQLQLLVESTYIIEDHDHLRNLLHNIMDIERQARDYLPTEEGISLLASQTVSEPVSSYYRLYKVVSNTKGD